jgi:hypothetical protein
VRTGLGWSLIALSVVVIATGALIPLVFSGVIPDYSDYEDVVAKGERVRGIVKRARRATHITIDGEHPIEIDVEDESGAPLVLDYKTKPGYEIEVSEVIEVARLGDTCYPVDYRPMEFPDFLSGFAAVLLPLGGVLLIAGVWVLLGGRKRSAVPREDVAD